MSRNLLEAGAKSEGEVTAKYYDHDCRWDEPILM